MALPCGSTTGCSGARREAASSALGAVGQSPFQPRTRNTQTLRDESQSYFAVGEEKTRLDGGSDECTSDELFGKLRIASRKIDRAAPLEAFECLENGSLSILFERIGKRHFKTRQEWDPTNQVSRILPTAHKLAVGTSF